MTNDHARLRRCDPFESDDFSISLQQLIAIGRPQQSMREMLAAGERPDPARASASASLA